MARILHIEDDPGNRLLVRKLLQAAGHQVVDAADGLEGVRLACGERPDLVLVDLNIPGLDGYEVTLRLRGEASLAGVPIVAITAEGDRDTSLAVGCDGFVQKPFDARGFARLVEGYLGGRRESAAPDMTGERLRAQSQRIVGHLEAKVDELSRANDRLRDLDRARTEFYRNVSHELATPMTPIVGYLELLIDGELGPIGKAQHKALRAMQDCVLRLRTQIDNLLDVTGLETGRMRFSHRPYDFAQVVRRAIELSSGKLAERQIELVDEMPDGEMPAVGDADRLQRAIVQLLDNAAKFTPEGGRVGVKLRRLPSGHHEVCVADSGPGVPGERADRIFEAFVQADGSTTREHGGAGVGLAIARRVAQGLGGDVRVQSPSRESVAGVPFGGAAFYLAVAERAPAPLGADPG